MQLAAEGTESVQAKETHDDHGSHLLHFVVVDAIKPMALFYLV